MKDKINEKEQVDNETYNQQVKEEKRLVAAEKAREKELKAKVKAKEEAKAELKAEELEARKKGIAERTAKIREVQRKKTKNEEDKAFLKRELVLRAKDNALLPRDLNKMYPSQMSLDEMVTYCKNNEIKVETGDSTVLLRLKIKAFRDPAQAERLRLLEKMPLEGRIVR